MKTLALTLTASTIAAFVLTSAFAAPALADTGDSKAIVTGGALSETVTGVDLTTVILDGKTTKHATGTSAQWSITDARGTGAVWALNATATNFVSAAGSVDTIDRTIDASNLSVTVGPITAVGASDAAPTASTPISLSTSTTTLLSAPANTKGTFTLTPYFDLSVPVNAYRSNNVGAANSTINPYIATVTYTIG